MELICRCICGHYLFARFCAYLMQHDWIWVMDGDCRFETTSKYLNPYFRPWHIWCSAESCIFHGNSHQFWKCAGVTLNSHSGDRSDIICPGGQYSDETSPSTKKKLPSAGSKTCIGSQMRSYMMSNSPSIWRKAARKGLTVHSLEGQSVRSKKLEHHV